MVKYIATVLQSLESLVAGMKTNATQWANLPLTVTELETSITQLKEQSAKIDAADATLQKERDAAHKMVDALKAQLIRGENLVFALHSEELVKLADYGLSQRKGSESRSIPAKATITSIADDRDGEGFVVSWLTLALADHYEVEKGVAPNITDLVLAPPYTFLKTTTKSSLLDDAVEKGKRYFYRVRGINAAGSGEWSEPVSRVQ